MGVHYKYSGNGAHPLLGWRYSLVFYGNIEKFIRELDRVTSYLKLKPRADDSVMKSEMYNSIARKGYVSYKDLTNNVDNKTTLNTLDVYLIGCGIKSDLITRDVYLRKTLSDRKNK